MNKKKMSILCIVLSLCSTLASNTQVLATTKVKTQLNRHETGNRAITSTEEQELILKAENALKEGEKYLVSGYVEIAKAYVNQLKDGPTKESLNARIYKLEKAIASAIENANKDKINEARKAVEKYENSLKREDMQSAQKLVSNLPDCAIKTSLKDRLVEAEKKALAYEKILTATAAVEKAYNTLQESDLKNAINLVNKLDESKEKTDLLYKIEKIKIAMENVDVERVSRAIEAVQKVEKSSKREDYNTAQSLVNRLARGDVRTNLENRLKNILDSVKKLEQLEKELAVEKEKISKATEAVIKLETTLITSDLNTAVSLVDKLKDGSEKKALKDRIEKAKDKIKNANQEKIDEATTAVNLAESTLMKELFDRAKTLVSKLETSDGKKALEQRLKVIQEKIKQSESDKDKINKIQLKYCKEQVDIFEKTPKVSEIYTIDNLLKILKDDNEKAKLVERFTTLKDFFISKLENKAKYDIKIAKRLKNQESIKIAKASVSLLPEGTVKNSLFSDISNIK
ncbi:hypothetical protein SAMN02745248_01756 [Hathewaya proteolytica DSM 3090]|uniref:Uncharacterized protein n=1 Tax=Hathewaya proteolytica DSM 3090 TaxID=1121331 RepID=A0A1M6PLT6_9CLOT|nr:hypothetical protein [Hathewaya proteolytica]SHK08890.1 hypothetical protein SAMN02745248_01756 [Hathewaya proteolytica DSM 3090]